jgi:hypothetical protein
VHERRTVPQVSEVRRLAVVRSPAQAGTEGGRAGRRRATPRGVTALPAGPRHGMEKASGREKPRRARAAFDGETRRRYAPTGSGPDREKPKGMERGGPAVRSRGWPRGRRKRRTAGRKPLERGRARREPRAPDPRVGDLEPGARTGPKGKGRAPGTGEPVAAARWRRRRHGKPIAGGDATPRGVGDHCQVKL